MEVASAARDPERMRLALIAMNKGRTFDDRRLAAQKRIAKQTPEQRSAIVRKAHATARLRELHDPELAKLKHAQRSERIKKGFAAAKARRIQAEFSNVDGAINHGGLEQD
jgi:hypothetical protein